MTKFWGLVMDNGKRYTQKVSSSFCVTMAVLDMKGVSVKDALDKVIKLYLVRDQQDFLLGVFTPKSCQLPVKIKFGKGETITFYMEGGPTGAKLHLTGYSLLEMGTLVSVPFKGQQQSILVTEPKSADKAKKRVSIKESPEAQKEASTSEEDDDDDDDDDLGLGDENDESEDDVIGSKKPALVNGTANDDDDVQVILQGKKKSLQSLIDEAASSDDDEEDGDADLQGDDDDDDDDDDEDDEDDEEDEDDSDDSDEEMEIETSKTQPQKGINKQAEQQKNSPKKVNQQSPNQAKQNQAQGVRKSEPAAAPKTPENKQLKPKLPSSAGHTPMKFYSKSGVMCQDVKMGSGAPAKPGRMVTVYYSGRLKSNNKKFDASESGPGFKFRLGKGEVIKGWDLGVDGMKVGGKRRLTIPANLAYGKRGAPPDIPPNSTLVFDVELRNVN